MLAWARVATVRDVATELDTVRLSGPPVWPTIVREVRALLGTEAVWIHRPERTARGWTCELAHADGLAAEFARFVATIAELPNDYAWYRPSSPEPAQRNRVIEALGAVQRARPGYFERTPLYAR